MAAPAKGRGSGRLSSAAANPGARATLPRVIHPPRVPTAYDPVIVMLVSIEAREGVCPERRSRLVSVLACAPRGRRSMVRDSSGSGEPGRASTKNCRNIESVSGHPTTHRSFVTVMIPIRPRRRAAMGASRDSSGNRRYSVRGGSSGRIGGRRCDFWCRRSRQPSGFESYAPAPGAMFHVEPPMVADDVSRTDAARETCRTAVRSRDLAPPHAGRAVVMPELGGTCRRHSGSLASSRSI